MVFNDINIKNYITDIDINIFKKCQYINNQYGLQYIEHP